MSKSVSRKAVQNIFKPGKVVKGSRPAHSIVGPGKGIPKIKEPFDDMSDNPDWLKRWRLGKGPKGDIARPMGDRYKKERPYGRVKRSSEQKRGRV